MGPPSTGKIMRTPASQRDRTALTPEECARTLEATGAGSESAVPDGRAGKLA